MPEYTVEIIRKNTTERVQIGQSFGNKTVGFKTEGEAIDKLAQLASPGDSYQIIFCPRDGQTPCSIITEKPDITPETAGA